MTRALRPGLKVLFASGYASDTLAQHGVEAGADQFLEKPYSMQGLKAKVRNVLDA